MNSGGCHQVNSAQIVNMVYGWAEGGLHLNQALHLCRMVSSYHVLDISFKIKFVELTNLRQQIPSCINISTVKFLLLIFPQ